MSSDRVLDYLTEELVVEKNIVTYRSLSNALGIHVNAAKNELAFYYLEHAGSLDAARATYIISGEPRVSYLDSVRDAEEMAIDDEETVEHSEDVSETKITLVGEAELENSKGQYARIDYIHIYSLSPSPIREPALLCEPAIALREAGKGKNNDASSSVALGRITGPHVKKRTDVLPTRSSANAKPTAPASTSKSKLPGLSRAASTTTDTKPVVKSEPKDLKLGVKEELPKPKPSGKLDFSKAKPAAPKAISGVRKTELAEPSSMPEVASSKPERKTSKPKGKVCLFSPHTRVRIDIWAYQPPVERKSTMKFSDSEDESSTKAATRPQELPSKRSGSKSTARVKKGVILSDEEEEEEAPKPARPKAAYKVKTERRSPDLADAESELRAMMDIDDDQVTRVSRTVTSAASESATSPPVSDVDMDAAEPEPAPAPSRKPQRKPKKQVPVGRNGLKKRRVVKSRMRTDDKGYFVTEDYSSYESVDEEAPPPEKPVKGKGKGKKAAIVPAASKSDDEPAEEKVIKAPAKKALTLERKPSRPNVQKGGIANYFTKK
ncbi:DNA polymerase subunit Cdc27 [Lactarius sanguifluus]|nr:DNA polymerase subunit Cdc27 [Lactarius sanguifluus]